MEVLLDFTLCTQLRMLKFEGDKIKSQGSQMYRLGNRRSGFQFGLCH
jgi:hypothetical protein